MPKSLVFSVVPVAMPSKKKDKAQKRAPEPTGWIDPRAPSRARASDEARSRSRASAEAEQKSRSLSDIFWDPVQNAEKGRQQLEWGPDAPFLNKTQATWHL